MNRSDPARPALRALMALVLALAAGCQRDDNVHVGFLGGLSGSLADLGVGGRNGAPGGKRRESASNGGVGLVNPGGGKSRDRLLGRGVDDANGHVAIEPCGGLHVSWSDQGTALARASPSWTNRLYRRIATSGLTAK